MAKGQDIFIGPWPDGLNLLDKPDQLRDTQLAECINFDVDNTGVLTPRRGFRSMDASHYGAGASLKLLGSIVLDGEVRPRAVVGSWGGVNTVFKFLGRPTEAAVDGGSAAGQFSTVVQYLNKIWYIPSVAGSVGQSSPATATPAKTAVGAMPYGDLAFILKDRLFIVRKASSELFFSKATDFTVWAAPDGGVIQVNPGDNSPITKAVVVNNQVIIFKRNSTWVLSFTTSPTGDGVLRQVSADQGAIDAVVYNNEVYCYNARSVFKFVNGFFQDIGIQLNLPSTNIDSQLTTGRLTVINKTLIIANIGFAGLTYAMNLDTGAWSQYLFISGNILSSLAGTHAESRSADGLVHFFSDGLGIFYTLDAYSSLFTLDGTFSGVNPHLTRHHPRYTIQTKDMTFDDSEVFKRLYAWWADVKYVAAYVTPNTEASTAGDGISRTSTDVIDLIGNNTSFRFKRVSLRVYMYSDAAWAGAFGQPVGPVVRGFRAVIGAKAPVAV